MILLGKNENNIEMVASSFSQGDVVYSIYVTSDEGNATSVEETLREILALVE